MSKKYQDFAIQLFVKKNNIETQFFINIDIHKNISIFNCQKMIKLLWRYRDRTLEASSKF